MPAGVTLTDHNGSCAISTNNAVLDGRRFNCSLTITGRNVTIRNSRVNGTIQVSGSGSLTIIDSEVVVAPGNLVNLIGDRDFTVIRTEVRGGFRGILCGNNCTVRDSWVHGQNAVGDSHVGGIRQSQNGVLVHNSIACDAVPTAQGGGCSAPLTGYGDFEPVANNLIERNLFIASPNSGYCAYGGASGDNGTKPFGHLSTGIRFIDNVFQRSATGYCGYWGTIADFDPQRPGNVFRGNRYSDGAPLEVG